MFTNNMDSNIYLEIMLDKLVPFIYGKYPDSFVILHQDNDPKHSSNICKKFLRDNDIKWVLKLYFK